MFQTRLHWLLALSIASFGCIAGGPGDPIDDGNISDQIDDFSADEENTAEVSQDLTNTKYIATCSNTGYSETSCEIFCPPSYMATGGGCRANHVHWELRENRPTTSGEGWRCTASEDFKTQVYNQSVTGYAVCVLK